MAANLKVPMSDYSFGDTSLMFRARHGSGHGR